MAGVSAGPWAVHVRALWPHDWRIVRDLRVAALNDAADMLGVRPDAPRRGSERYWRGWPEHGVPLAAFRAQAPVGLVGVIAPPRDPGTAHLVALWVSPAARGAGVGDALVEAVVAVARQWGRLAVALEVLTTNHPAIRLYQRQGFVVSPTTPKVPGAIAMWRDLRP